MRNRKRLTSLILAAVMLCALLVPSVSPAYAASPSEITQQIRNTYQASLQKAGRSSFNGYCGLYVNWQLVILGINSSYVGGNGNDEYDNYCNLSRSSGGYSIAAYPASQYSLQSALNAISANGTRDVTNILVGFEKGSGSDGALYGHTCFIHAIIDGNVYFSESFNATVGGTYYAEGSPIVCSISTFCSYYGSWTVLDGVIHFGGSTPPSPSDDSLSLYSYNYPTSLDVGEAFSIYGTVSSGYSNISSLTVGVYNSSGSLETGKTVCPNSKTYSIANVDNYVLFNTLSAGTHYYRISATNASGTKQLLNKQFSVVGTPTVGVVRMVNCYRKVQLPARVINLYWNPTDTSRASYFDYGPYLGCPTYAEMTDGSIMYKANVTHQGVDTQMWFKLESDMSVTVKHTYGSVQYEYAHPHAAYETCACGYVHYTGSNGSRDDCTECHPVTFTGRCGDNLTWALGIETGMLTISGSGEMTNWADSWAVPWYSKRDYIKSVSIGNNVTSIGYRVFCGCSKLTSVTIGNSVMSIGMFAFDDCTGLTSITIPDSVTDIDWFAFCDCSGLTSIYIPDSVTSVSADAFYGCSGLTSITVDRDNTIYDSRNNCNAIIETATNTLIAGCKNTVIPNNITSIDVDAFGGCTELTSVTIPNSVMSIEDGAFQGCTGLKTITIPNTVTSIGSYAFNRTGYYNNASNWTGDLLYIGNHLIAVNETISGACSIKPGTKTIAGEAFKDCTGLTSVTIPDSVMGIGNDAFYGCTGLTNVTIPDSVTSIGKSAFRRCSELTTIILPDSVTNIGNYAFDECTGLKDVYFTGTEEEWNATKIGSGNDCLTGANIHFVDLHTHSYIAVVTAPTCTAEGYTTYSCSCGERYKADFIGALGHNYVNGICTRCGAKNPDDIPAVPTIEFSDVPANAWYVGAVDFAVENSLMNGVGDKKFDPEGSMTRAMLVTVLWRYEGSPKKGTNTFSDVPNGQWYTDAIAWAFAEGVVGGVGDGKFEPEGKITREQMATILFRYAQKKGMDTSKCGNLGGFPDANRVSSYAKDAVQWSVGEGIINGSDGKLLPQGNATRAQVATILMRYIENITKK